MTERSPNAGDTAQASVRSDIPTNADLLPPKDSTPDAAAMPATPPLADANGTPPPPPPPSPANARVVAAIVTEVEPEEPGLDLWGQMPSWLASMVVHLTLVLLLALISFSNEGLGGLQDLLVSVDQGGSQATLEELQSEMMQSSDALEELPQLPAADMADTDKLADLAGAIGLERPVALPGTTEPILSGGDGGSQPTPGGSQLELRLSGQSREQQLIAGGGTKGSEDAVKKALFWLSEHQHYDGSWTFAHQKSPRCHGSCDDPGFTPGKIAATAMALLPFLGTGQTQLEGQYKRNIDLGLRFLVRSMKIQGDLGSLYEDSGGQMYGHGLATIALCEAYGMTHDQTLREPAQAAINFIAEAQDPLGGGWRYMPRQTGDTSVVGWQLMALKSAEMAYLKVPASTVRKAGYFLDTVQSDRGAIYGYQRPERGRPATTAIGLLCRMYMGWKRDNPGLQNGVRILSALGPSIDSSTMQNNMYYNYYATQVMHHYGGSEWRRWNQVMREYLIKSQANQGHETGSWYFEGADLGSPAGGRLYCTAMAAMTLEVYYRYMPLYRPQSTELQAQQ